MEKEQFNGDYPDLRRECIDLSAICGTWESISGEPLLIIYGDRMNYKISVIHIASSGQASPSSYEIQQDVDGYYIYYNLIRMGIAYDPYMDELEISHMGKYLRN